MKRLLDALLSRWYVPAERYADVVTSHVQQHRIVVETLAEAKRIVGEFAREQEAIANKTSPSVLVTGLQGALDSRPVPQTSALAPIDHATPTSVRQSLAR